MGTTLARNFLMLKAFEPSPLEPTQEDWALPHFYFHVVTAYDILRHEGAEIGKREYLGHVAKYIRPPAGA